MSYNQEDWVDFLFVAEFEANSSRSASTGVAPFLATKGYMPRSGIEPPTPWDSNATQRAKRDMVAADTFVERIENMRIHLRQELAWARAIQEEFANRHRLPAPEMR